MQKHRFDMYDCRGGYSAAYTHPVPELTLRPIPIGGGIDARVGLRERRSCE